MNYKGYARAFQIHLFIAVFSLPLLIDFLARKLGLEWTEFVLLAHAIAILLIFVRKGWMTFLRSKFPDLDFYAIRFALAGFMLSSMGIIEASMSDNHDTLTAFGKVIFLPALLMIGIAMLGTLGQAFVDSIKALLNYRDK